MAKAARQVAAERGLLADRKPKAVVEDQPDQQPDNVTPLPPARIPLSGRWEGHWVEMRRGEQTAKEYMALARAGEDLTSAIEVLVARITGHSLGGDITDQTITFWIELMKGIRTKREELALDPPSAGG